MSVVIEDVSASVSQQMTLMTLRRGCQGGAGSFQHPAGLEGIQVRFQTQPGCSRPMVASGQSKDSCNGRSPLGGWTAVGLKGLR